MKANIHKIVAAIGVTASLAGCFTMHEGQTYPTLVFSAPMTYQEAYRRLDAHARECMPAPKKQGAIYTDNQTADYHFIVGMANEEPMKVLIKSTGATSSEVAITYVNVMGWNEGMANSMKRSILAGKPDC